MTTTAFAQTTDNNSTANITQDNDSKTINKTVDIDKSMHDSQKIRINCKQSQVNKPENDAENKPDSDQDQTSTTVQVITQTQPVASGSPDDQTVTTEQTQTQTTEQPNTQTSDQSNNQTQENCDITVNNGDTRPFPSFSPSVTNITNVTNPATSATVREVFTSTIPSAAPATGFGR